MSQENYDCVLQQKRPRGRPRGGETARKRIGAGQEDPRTGGDEIECCDEDTISQQLIQTVEKARQVSIQQLKQVF